MSKINKEALKAVILRNIEFNQRVAERLQSTEDAEKAHYVFIGYKNAMEEVLIIIEGK
jgi:hypothetical protein